MECRTNLVRCGPRPAPGCTFIELDFDIALKLVAPFLSANTCHRLAMLLSRSTDAMLHVFPQSLLFLRKMSDQRENFEAVSAFQRIPSVWLFCGF